MLTPAFEIKQDDTFIIIFIKAPFAKITDTEIFVEECEFRFYSKPYFLRLNLPAKIVEDGKETAKYDSDQGTFTIKMPKATPGENFEGLNLITKLLIPKAQQEKRQPQIEVLGTNENESANVDTDEEEEDFDWHIEQEPYTEPEPVLDAPKYGFANQKSGVFKLLQDEIYEIIDLKSADTCLPSKRREQRIEAENEKFDPDYYQADYFQDDAIQEVMTFDPTWCQEMKKLDKIEKTTDVLQFSDEQKEKMRNLPKKEYMIDEAILMSTYLGLIDIVFAYAYNIRTTDGEGNVESGWTISKLSAVLSWLDVFTNIDDVCCSCVRRSLCYPLYRNWKLSLLVIKDTQQIFSLGKQKLLSCLLDIHSIFSESYPRYILNDLYITDYCVWIQSASDKRLKSIADTLLKVKIDKSTIGFDLCELEAVSDETDELAECVFGLNIKNADKDSDDDDDDDVDDETDTTESYDTSESDDNEEEDDTKDSSSEIDKSINYSCTKEIQTENDIVSSLSNDVQNLVCINDSSVGFHRNKQIDDNIENLTNTVILKKEADNEGNICITETDPT